MVFAAHRYYPRYDVARNRAGLGRVASGDCENFRQPIAWALPRVAIERFRLGNPEYGKRTSLFPCWSTTPSLVVSVERVLAAARLVVRRPPPVIQAAVRKNIEKAPLNALSRLVTTLLRRRIASVFRCDCWSAR